MRGGWHNARTDAHTGSGSAAAVVETQRGLTVATKPGSRSRNNGSNGAAPERLARAAKVGLGPVQPAPKGPLISVSVGMKARLYRWINQAASTQAKK